MRRIWVTTSATITQAIIAEATAAGATEIVSVARGYPPALVAAGITTPGYHEIAAPAPNPRDTNKRTVEDRARAALTANATFRALQSPTNAQVLAQVRRLTAQCSALIRLMLNELDTIDDTNGT